MTLVTCFFQPHAWLACTAAGDGAAASAGTSHGPQAPSAPEPRALWVNLHAPASEAELVVHKKKVQEIRVWMEWQLESLGHKGVSRVAVVSGGLWGQRCGVAAVLSWWRRAEPSAQTLLQSYLLLKPCRAPLLGAPRCRAAGVREVHCAARAGWDGGV